MNFKYSNRNGKSAEEIIATGLVDHKNQREIEALVSCHQDEPQQESTLKAPELAS
jgi:hypothetical protein